MPLIYKILSETEWAVARSVGCFEGSEVDRADGYIHFSTADQAGETARRHFFGREGLMVLVVDADSLGAALRWEVSRGGERFPHLYRPLDCAEVILARPARLGADGAPDLGDLAP